MIGSIELQIISKILSTENEIELNTLLDFDESYYSVFKEHIKFIRDHRAKYGDVPDVFTFQAQFPDVTLIKVTEPLTYLSRELKKNKQQLLLLETFNKLKDLGSGDVTDAWKYLSKQCEKSEELSDNKPLNLVSDAKERANQILKFAEQTRIPTGFSEIDKMDWYSMDKEDFGDLYEGLLEKNASEKKSGAGQYFTPRVLIDTIVKVTKPQLKERICDPASGTLGFIISANRYIKESNNDYYGISEEAYDFQKKEAFSACELVPDTHRLGIMNALLHGVEGNFLQGDTLSATGTQLKNFDLILSNPPFGTKKGGERATRDDLVYSSSNKQLNFLEIIYRSLNLTGKARAGVVLPDNVLFEGGIGKDIRQDLLNKCNVHTILRLPTGIFYAQGVKTNVLFFNRAKTDIGNTKDIWFYDLRTNMPNFGKTTPLTEKYFEEFISTYENDEEKEKLERWTKISLDEIIKKDYSLDLGLIKDESLLDIEALPNPILNTNETIEKLEEAIDLLKSVVNELKNCGLSEED